MRASLLKKFYPIIFVTIVVFISVTLLTFTESITRAKLESQQDQQTLDMLKEMFPDMNFYILEDDIYIIYAKRTVIGYAFLAVGNGWGGEIDILVGLEDKETIKGIFVVSHSEALIYWNMLVRNNFFDQFIGLKIEDAYFTRDGGQVDAVTRATISAEAVVDAVRTTALEKVKSLR